MSGPCPRERAGSIVLCRALESNHLSDTATSAAVACRDISLSAGWEAMVILKRTKVRVFGGALDVRQHRCSLAILYSVCPVSSNALTCELWHVNVVCLFTATLLVCDPPFPLFGHCISQLLMESTSFSKSLSPAIIHLYIRAVGAVSIIPRVIK